MMSKMVSTRMERPHGRSSRQHVGLGQRGAPMASICCTPERVPPFGRAPAQPREAGPRSDPARASRSGACERPAPGPPTVGAKMRRPSGDWAMPARDAVGALVDATAVEGDGARSAAPGRSRAQGSGLPRPVAPDQGHDLAPAYREGTLERGCCRSAWTAGSASSSALTWPPAPARSPCPGTPR